jgi:pimeloyl-ACP methyl ester carboxylesterase
MPVDLLPMPVLAIGGSADPASRPSDSEALVHAVPDGRLEILPDCGHFPMVERADAFSAAVHGFLRTLHPPGPSGATDRVDTDAGAVPVGRTGGS